MGKHTVWPGVWDKALRFALLFHSKCPQGDHFDLVLELKRGQRLWTLKMSTNPLATDSPKLTIHGFIRRRYLTFQGDIGRGRGMVQQIASGSYTISIRQKLPVLTFHIGEKDSILYFVEQVDQKTLQLLRSRPIN